MSVTAGGRSGGFSSAWASETRREVAQYGRTAYISGIAPDSAGPRTSWKWCPSVKITGAGSGWAEYRAAGMAGIPRAVMVNLFPDH